MHPILFKLGPLTVYSYGFLVAVAFLSVYVLAQKKASQVGLSPGNLLDLLLVLFVSGVVGARFFYVLQHLEDFRGRWWDSFMIQEGGLVWYGGFLIAATTGFLTAYLRRWPLLKLADFFTPYLALAQGIGRMGCFLNGCCYGKPSNVFWATRFSSDVARHPVQIYEAAASFLIFVFLFKFYECPSKSRRTGIVFVLYLILYAVTRFGLEFFRGDQILIGRLSQPQWTSLALFLGALFLYGFIRKKSSR